MGLSEVQSGTDACHCNTEVIPLKRKMHILKKIKKRFGLARRSPTSCPGPNNLPPLQFHAVHGDNIRISRDGTLARRFESFCRAITFSARPVRVNERVCVKFVDVANNWNGGVRFGFTNHDPSTLESALPKYACPDLTNRPGFWAKALHEQYCEKDNVLFYYVNSAGDVVYGINGDEKGVIFSGIDTRGPLWTLLDIYGNCTAVEFLDARIYMYQQSAGYQQRRSLPDTEVDRVVVPSIQSLNLSDDTSSALPPVRYNANGRLIPVPFHITKGRNIRLSADRFIATRTETDFCQGYVFTARPLRIGEKVIVQILKTEHMYVGALALGLTSCNPATLQPSDLPDDSDFLLDRPEYWVVSKDIASTPQRGDEIAFCVTPSGEVTISKNDGAPIVVMHVDQSLQLWAFLDVYGSTQSVRVFRQPPVNLPPMQQQTCGGVSQVPTSPRRLQVALPASESINSLSSQISDSRKLSASAAVIAAPAALTTTSASTSNGRMISVPSNGDMIQIQPGGTVLVVNLPPAHPEVAQPGSSQSRNSQIPVAAVSAGPPGYSATMMSNGSSTYIEPCTIPSSANSYNTLNQWKDTGGTGDSSNSGAECTICYENQIDSVLYMCGHMCMCYECAIEQWRGVGGGQCPLCRAVIRDVIRTYTT
ncbi:protein neuralized isoform X1 [Hermetia illucens]|nr:protein neuralized isoform X1 [Hermetia illucens]